MEESHDCNLGQPKPHRPGTYTARYLVEQVLNARHMRAESDDPENLIELAAIHFLLGGENASALFMQSSEQNHDLKK